MAVIGRAQIQQAIQVLQEERNTMLASMPLAEMQSVWLAAAKEAMPEGDGRRGGHTADTLHTIRMNVFPQDAVMEIGGSKVARFLYTGTIPHRIPFSGTAVPKLHFFWERMGGQEMFLPYVNHPGTKPQPWREMAREIARPVVIELSKLGIRAWMFKIAGRMMQ